MFILSVQAFHIALAFCAFQAQIYSKMESLITSYGINFKSFQQTIKNLNGLVAGSSALAEYLKQEGIEPGFQPNDIDIFIPGYKVPARDAWNCIIPGKYEIKSLNIMKEFLAMFGFNENGKFSTLDKSNEDYSTSLNKIQKVTSFYNADKDEIQIIVVDDHRLLDYIYKDFDLSACISWWNSDTNTFHTMNPYTTKRKEIYITRNAGTGELHRMNKLRIHKYKVRGFKIIDKPCPFVDERDSRDLLSDKKFDDIEVTDIFTLDAISIRDYLQKSEWNIVIKAGEAFYGFERKVLMDCLNSKPVSIDRIGKLYKTPLNQCITLEAFNKLRYSDYSIYELKSAYSVPSYGGRVNSLFHMHCYSIKQWVNGSGATNIMIPPQHLITAPSPITRIIRRGEPLPPQNPNLPFQMPEITVDDILAAHAHLLVPGNLEAFHAAVREIHGEA